VKNLFTSSFLSKLNAAQFVNGPQIGFKLIRTGVFVQALIRSIGKISLKSLQNRNRPAMEE